MAVPIADMRNLGPATARMLAEIDVHTDEDLRAIGAVEAYCRLKFVFGRHISLLGLYAMEAALAGQDWRSLSDEQKADLKARLTHRQG